MTTQTMDTAAASWLGAQGCDDDAVAAALIFGNAANASAEALAEMAKRDWLRLSADAAYAAARWSLSGDEHSAVLIRVPNRHSRETYLLLPISSSDGPDVVLLAVGADGSYTRHDRLPAAESSSILPIARAELPQEILESIEAEHQLVPAARRHAA